MKRKKIRDIIVGCFLISTLGIASFIVSCSDQDNIISNNLDQSSPYHQHIHGLSGPTVDPITGLFTSIGESAGNQLEGIGMGWALGALGITGASGPNWQKEFNTINNDLTQIINLLTQADQELNMIYNELQVLNCSNWQTQLVDEISIINVQLEAYNQILFNSTHPVPDTAGVYAASSELAVQVLSPTNSVLSALSTIQINLSSPENAGAIFSCLGPIPKPANGTFRSDSVYYVTAQNLLNYYYYWQTIALGLISEAYHWNAWVAAGGSGSGYSADSAQEVCNSSNPIATGYCNDVVGQSNIVYNSLLYNFKGVGAPYTGEDLIYQKNANGEDVVWVRSIEDYTAQSGANCNYPLNMNNLCGPTVGKFGSTLSFTTYYGTQNFQYPSYNELNGLVNPTPTMATTENVGNFLDSVGFENMNVNPPKVLIADTLIKLTSTGNDFNYYIDTMTVIPYISPGYPLFTVENSHNDVYKRAIYSELYDFIGYNKTNATTVAMYYTGYYVMSTNPCQDEGVRGIQTAWSVASAPGPFPWAGKLGSAGWIQFCQNWNNGTGNYDIHLLIPFTWNASYSPGWSYYSKNSVPQDAFFIPVRTNFSGSTGCLPSTTPPDYSNLNLGGFITMCGQDFQNYLNLNLPIPPTCAMPSIQSCTQLP